MLGLGVSLTSPAVRAGATAKDPHLSSVVLLSGFDSPQGSTSFVDEGPKGKAITTVGANVYADEGNRKFGGASFRRDNSMGGYLSVADSEDFNFGAAPFTIEQWVRWEGDPASGTRYIVAQFDTNSQRSWAIATVAGTLRLFLASAGATTITKINVPFAPALNQFYHVACDFDGTTYRLYVDGVVVGSATTAVTLFNSTAPVTVGVALNTGVFSGNFVGQIDEMRITKGVARYSGAFTPPTGKYPRS